jgi:hypothetical protein
VAICGVCSLHNPAMGGAACLCRCHVMPTCMSSLNAHASAITQRSNDPTAYADVHASQRQVTRYDVHAGAVVLLIFPLTICARVGYPYIIVCS